MSKPAPYPGTAWTRAADLKQGQRIYGGELFGRQVSALVLELDRKPKTVWVTLGIQEGGYTVARQKQRPRHDDEFMVFEEAA